MEISGSGNVAGGSFQNMTAGIKILASVVKSDGAGNYLLNIGGNLVDASSPDRLSGKGLRLEIVAVEPKLIVKLVSEKTDVAGLLKLLLTPSTQLKTDIQSQIKTSVLAFMAKEMGTFEQKAVVAMLKDFGAAKLAAFTPDDIRRVLRDSGLFFEKKLIDGVSLKSDMKLGALTLGNEPAREAMTKVQIANVMMDGGFFAFFESDSLDFDNGVMRFKRSDDGSLYLYMKLDFTQLGQTVVSFAKNINGGYNITVRTNSDISEQLSSVNLEGCTLRWVKLKEKDISFFEIKKEDIDISTGLDLQI